MSIPSVLFRTMRVYGKMLPKRISGLGKLVAAGREVTREVGAAVTRVCAGTLFVAIISTKSSCVAGVVGS